MDRGLSLYTPEEIAERLGARFREERLRQGLRQETLAEAAGVSVATIRRLETEARVTLDTLLTVAFALGRIDEFADIMAPPRARTMAELERQEAFRARKPKRGRR